jgi:hypothetical protein
LRWYRYRVKTDFRSVQNLPFRYLCGRDFVSGFAAHDRGPLWLPAHTACNSAYRLTDEKIGQLIALRYGKVPHNRSHRRLKFAYSRGRDLGAVVNLDVDGAVWPWIGGSHAALYREAGVGIRGPVPFTWLMARGR